MKILLQFPEGLKEKATAIAGELESQGHTVFISAAQCFGACDLALEEARMLQVDLLKHYGHAEFHHVKGEKFDIEYVPYPIDARLGILSENLALLKPYRKVGLLTTVQHIHQLPEMKAILEQAGHEVVLAKGGAHTRHAGQLLGCDSVSAAVAQKDADCLAYVGGGIFHPTGVDAKMPFFVFDPYSWKAYQINDAIEKLRRKKKGMLLACTQDKVKRFGILVSTKNGQYNLAGAIEAKKRLEEKGRQAFILVSNFIDTTACANFNSFDAYVNTACPRIPEDYERFGRPVIDMSDLRKLLELL